MLTFGNFDKVSTSSLRNYSITIDGTEATGTGSISTGQSFFDSGSDGFYASAYLTEISKICVFAFDFAAVLGELPL